MPLQRTTCMRRVAAGRQAKATCGASALNRTSPEAAGAPWIASGRGSSERRRGARPASRRRRGRTRRSKRCLRRGCRRARGWERRVPAGGPRDGQQGGEGSPSRGLAHRIGGTYRALQLRRPAGLKRWTAGAHRWMSRQRLSHSLDASALWARARARVDERAPQLRHAFMRVSSSPVQVARSAT